MYEVKTLLPQFEMSLPTCMYTVKNVSLAGDTCGAGTADGYVNKASSYRPGTACHTNSTSKPPDCVLNLDVLASDIDRILKSSSEVELVRGRQHKVLEHLNELRKQLAIIRKSIGLCQKHAQTGAAKTLNNGGLIEEPFIDVVVNGHPNFIPYALLGLKNAWKDVFNINVRTFTHSTMTDIGDEARAFEKSLHDIKIEESKPKVTISLIWKNCEHTEMISSPTMYVPIYGEINIIRYLGRVGPLEYRYENSDQCNEIDAVLDICYQLLRCSSKKDKAHLIRALSNRLHKRKFFAGDEFSIADIAVHSTLKRIKIINTREMTSALKVWLQHVAPITLL